MPTASRETRTDRCALACCTDELLFHPPTDRFLPASGRFQVDIWETVVDLNG